MCGERRTGGRPEEAGASHSGGPAPVPPGTIGLQRINDTQGGEGIARGDRDSDPAIVVLEEAGRTVHPATWTPQGGVISPVLADIRLHYVQDLWIKEVVAKRSKGRVPCCGVTGNSMMPSKDRHEVRRLLFKWPNRRSPEPA